MRKFEFIDKALWFPMEKILVISDLHIGYEDALASSGVFLPRGQFAQTFDDLKSVFSALSSEKKSKIGRIKKIVVLGDLKHEFGMISGQEWRETLKILDFLKDNSQEVVIIRGNHDKILEPIAKKRGIRLVDYYSEKDICFMHGEKKDNFCFDKKIKLVVLGHKHPAVSISDKYKQEKYKCFLVGRYLGKKIVILPSFFPLVEGSDVSGVDSGNFAIPDSRLLGFEVYAVGDEVYKMGRVKDIGRLN